MFCNTYLESNHELVICTICFKIKANRAKRTKRVTRATHGLSEKVKSNFKAMLDKAFPPEDHDSTTDAVMNVDTAWCTFKLALREASNILPVLPQLGN